jgi:hypothetical protein
MSYLTAFAGSNPRGNVEEGMVPLVFRHLPAGSSVKVMSQWAQVGEGGVMHIAKQGLIRILACMVAWSCVAWG